MKLKNCKTCASCHAYNNDTHGTGGFCALGFEVEQLLNPLCAAAKNKPKKDLHHVGRTSTGEYWTFACRPAEPCYKPTTIKEYVASFKLRHVPYSSK